MYIRSVNGKMVQIIQSSQTIDPTLSLLARLSRIVNKSGSINREKTECILPPQIKTTNPDNWLNFLVSL